MPEVTTILHVSDVHFGTEDTAALALFSDYVEQVEPALTVISGDLTQRGTKIEFAAAEQWTEQLKSPVLSVPGNHDTPLLNMQARIADPFKRYREYIGHEQTVYRDDGLAFATLNTARGWQARKNWAEGSVRMADLNAVISAVASVGPDNFSGVVCHHPMIQPPDTELPVNTKRGLGAVDRMCSSPVDVLLCGHVHQPSATTYENAEGAFVSIAAGTLSTRTRGSPASFNVIQLEADHFEVTAQFIVGEELEELKLGSFDRQTTNPS